VFGVSIISVPGPFKTQVKIAGKIPAAGKGIIVVRAHDDRVGVSGKSRETAGWPLPLSSNRTLAFWPERHIGQGGHIVQFVVVVSQSAVRSPCHSSVSGAMMV